MTPGPYFVAPDDPLSRAEALMRDHGIRHLPVVDERELVGVLSDRDLSLVQKAGAHDGEPSVADAMTREPYVVTPNAPLNHVARIMADRKIGSAVVVDRGAVIGVFTVTDGMQALVEALEGTYNRRTFEGVPTAPGDPRRPKYVR
jgi:acetoin utilization protein AcuB